MSPIKRTLAKRLSSIRWTVVIASLMQRLTSVVTTAASSSVSAKPAMRARVVTAAKTAAF